MPRKKKYYAILDHSTRKGDYLYWNMSKREANKELKKIKEKNPHAKIKIREQSHKW